MTTDVLKPVQMTMSARDWFLLLCLGAIWGGSFFFARIAVAEIPPIALVLFRVAIAALALHIYVAIRGPSLRLALPRAASFIVLACLNNIIPFSLIFLGQTELGAGLASVLNATTPFWTVLIANAFTRDEKLSWNKVAGIVLGIAGTAVMIGPGCLPASAAPPGRNSRLSAPRSPMAAPAYFQSASDYFLQQSSRPDSSRPPRSL